MTIKQEFKQETGLEVFDKTYLMYNTEYVLWLERRIEQLTIPDVVRSADY